MCCIWQCALLPAISPRVIRSTPIARTVIAEIVVPQRATFLVTALEPSPTAISAALVPIPKASMVRAPPTAVAAPIALINARVDADETRPVVDIFILKRRKVIRRQRMRSQPFSVLLIEQFKQDLDQIVGEA